MISTSGGFVRTLAIILVAGGFLVALGWVLPEGQTLVAKPLRQGGLAPDSIRHAEEQRRAELALRFRQGVTMMQLGEYRHAITAFHRVLELEPALPEAHVNMGFAFFELKDHAGALRFFDGALVLAPKQSNAHYGRALALEGLGRSQDAAVAMSRYLELSPVDDPFRGKAEKMLSRLGVDRRVPKTLTVPGPHNGLQRKSFE